MNSRMVFGDRSEEATATELRRLGLTVEPYGQALLNERAREILRGNPTAKERWTPDLLVRSNQGAFLVDAKHSEDKTDNMTIEMRSLLAAWDSGLSTYFVHSIRTGPAFGEFRVISARTAWQRVARGLFQSCCTLCKWTLMHEPDKMRELPEHCKRQQKSGRASGTPWVLIPRRVLAPLTTEAFIDAAA